MRYCIDASRPIFLLSKLSLTHFVRTRSFSQIKAFKIMESHNGIRHLPSPKGPHPVGCTDLMIGKSPSSEGCFFRLFYPCELTTESIYECTSRFTPWMPHPKYKDGYSSVMGIPAFIGRRISSWIFGDFWIPAILNATPIKNKNLPVIIFSHGLTGCRANYSVICSDLSSYGFIVAAMEHRDGSACLSYNLASDKSNNTPTDEDWVPYKQMPSGSENIMSLRQEQLGVRSRECQAVLDNLQKINEGEDIGQHVLLSSIDLKSFKATMDFSNPIIAGHSFGSATLLRTLAVDKRFKIGVAMDSWMWPIKDEIKLPETVEQPILFINMEAFQTPPNLKAIKKFTAGVEHTERRVVTIKGSVHLNQGDMPFIVPFYLRRWLDVQSTIDPHLAIDLNTRIILHYLRKHLGHSVVKEHAEFLEKHKDLLLEGIP